MKKVQVRRYAHRDENGVVREVELPGGSGSTRKRLYSVVVADAAAGWTADDCDYLCDGPIDNETWEDIFSNIAQSGGTVQFLEGEYDFESMIQIQDSDARITLSGCGEGTILKIPPNSSSIFIMRSKNVAIQNMTIIEKQDGGGNTSAIVGLDVSDLTIRNVTIKGYTGYAIEVHCWVSEDNAKNIIVEDCKIDTRSVAVCMRGVDNCFIRRNIITISEETYGAIEHGSYYGLKYRPGHNVIISENMISATTPLTGIYSAAITPSENCIVQNNSIRNFSYFFRVGMTFSNIVVCGNIMTEALGKVYEGEGWGNGTLDESVVFENNIIRLRDEETEAAE